MYLYNGFDTVDWFYLGAMTADEMRADPDLRVVTEVPCVMYDNGMGKVYRFETLEALCARQAVPYTGDPASDYARLVESHSGTYKAPGVAEAQATADEAKTAADAAAASVNEYMDALLGLGATDETEAADAE